VYSDIREAATKKNLQLNLSRSVNESILETQESKKHPIEFFRIAVEGVSNTHPPKPDGGRSWLLAIVEAAAKHCVALPSFSTQGMGVARSNTTSNGRFVTFKRRLISAERSRIDGIEWSLWQMHDGLPEIVETFRVSDQVQPELVSTILRIFVGWLLNGWTPTQIAAALCSLRHARILPPPSST